MPAPDRSSFQNPFQGSPLPEPTGGKRVVQDVVLVEDNQVHRHIVHASFHQHFTPRRWREFDHGRSALDACLEDPPDLMLLDLQLPDIHGLELLKMLRQDDRHFAVIVLTASPREVMPAALLELHVDGYIDKLALKDSLPAAVHSVLDGRIYFSASRTPFPDEKTHRFDAASKLSVREKEIARLVAHGFRSKQIAGRLGLSVRTVENHRSRFMKRLGLDNVADLVRWCFQHGLE
jgi:DNA-binding NarL/FixJ family response regulator